MEKGKGKMCDFKNHNLIEIYTDGYYHERNVVRWCEDCGAIVVDTDADGRIYTGRIMKMKFPKSVYDKLSNQ